MKLNTNLLPLLAITMGAMSCAQVKSLITDFREATNPDSERVTDNRLQFGTEDASEMIKEAYQEIRTMAEARDLDWCTVMPVASLEDIWPLDAEIRQMQYSKSECVKTDFSPAFESVLQDSLRSYASDEARDRERWQLIPEDLLIALFDEAGIENRHSIFLPIGQERLRAAMQDDDDPVEYVLGASLSGTKIDNKRVEFTVTCQLVSLVESSDPITARRSTQVAIPIDFSELGGGLFEKIKGAKDIASL